MSLDKQIDEIESLKDNWDSYGAPTISGSAVRALRKISLIPTNRGGVTLEVSGTEITIDRNGMVCGIYYDTE